VRPFPKMLCSPESSFVRRDTMASYRFNTKA
jgi:hypothetical protein